MVKKIETLDDLTPDDQNANKHTARGTGMMEDSIGNLGAGDSLTVDKNGKVISGNQRAETFSDLQMREVIVVQTDGTKPIVHQRIDLDLDKDDRARKLAIASNRVGQVNLEWDINQLARDKEAGLTDPFFTDDELDEMIGQADPVEEIAVPRPAEIVWVLCAIPIEDWPKHQSAIEALQIDAKFSTMSIRSKKSQEDHAQNKDGEKG